jgi:hypothetical protein
LDPNWNAVWRHTRVGTTPGEYHSALFMYNETDDDLRRATPYLRKVRLTELDLQDTKFTDAAVPELLKLNTLETLHVQRTLFTVDGLLQLGSLPRLKMLYVTGEQFTEQDISRVRAAQPHVQVSYTPLPSARKWGAEQ